MRKWITIAVSLVGANVALYLAWLRTPEGRRCDRAITELYAERAAWRAQQEEIRDLPEVPDAQQSRQ